MTRNTRTKARSSRATSRRGSRSAPNDTGGAFSNEFDLRPVGEGWTEVTHSLQFPPLKGMSAVMLPILFPLVGKPQVRKRMQMLKAKAEAAV